MIDSSALSRAMVVGTALQVVLAILAYFSGWIAQHALLFGAMMLSAIAGYLYAQDVSKGYLAGWRECFHSCLAAVEEEMSRNESEWDVGGILPELPDVPGGRTN